MKPKYLTLFVINYDRVTNKLYKFIFINYVV